MTNVADTGQQHSVDQNQESIFKVRLMQETLSADIKVMQVKHDSLEKGLSSVVKVLEDMQKNMATKDDIKSKQLTIERLENDVKESNKNTEQKFSSLSQMLTSSMEGIYKKIDDVAGKSGTNMVDTAKVTTGFNIISGLVLAVVTALITFFATRGLGG